uniref:Chromosome segregation ATPase n=1 Tax=Chlorobium chlorochromatii (strain CaD3) TaxID=340177 RepID=Q3AU63_CHLCH
MEQQKLRELLQALHQELEQLQSVDESTTAVLTTLRNDTQRLLSNKEEPMEEEEGSLSERMQQALEHFEEKHPSLSISIQHVLDSLARMGL